MKRLVAAGVVATALVGAWRGMPASAHVTVISKYTFSQHVRPILQARCGACHGEGGPAFPLLQFEAARRQRWQIQQSLLSGRMPPWSAEAGATPFKASQSIGVQELNVLMTWAAGGTPQGAAVTDALPAPKPAWSLGPPDLVVPMPSSFTLEAEQTEATHEVILSANEVRGRAIRAVDLLPGTPPIVRRAEIAIRLEESEQIIGLWVPGDSPQLLEANAAYAVPREAVLILRVHYQRSSDENGAALSDRSQVGVYFAEPSARPVTSLMIGESVDIPNVVRVVAVRPVSGPAGAAVSLVIVAPDGSRKPLTRLRLRQRWPRRYVLTKPVIVPAGSRIEVSVRLFEEREWAPLVGDEPLVEEHQELRLALEIIG